MKERDEDIDKEREMQTKGMAKGDAQEQKWRGNHAITMHIKLYEGRSNRHTCPQILE